MIGSSLYTRWHSPPEFPNLTADAIHLWRFTAAGVLDGNPDAFRIFTLDEQRRAARFCFARDRERFVAARFALRAILARYAGTSLGRLAFGESATGKPVLTTPRCRRLTFNLSHCEEQGLLAVAWDRSLGVDLERHDAERDVMAAARAALTGSALEQLRRAATEEERRALFYQLWTRHEALLKASGGGFAGTDRAWLDGRANGWTVLEVPMPTGWSACLAHDGAPGAMALLDGTDWLAAQRPSSAAGARSRRPARQFPRHAR